MQKWLPRTFSSNSNVEAVMGTHGFPGNGRLERLHGVEGEKQVDMMAR